MNKILHVAVGLALAATGLVGAATSAHAGTTVAAPVISGSGKVGTTVTITGYGSLAGLAGGYTYAWMWEGESDPGPGDSGSAHVITKADVGHGLSVLVMPVDPDADRLESNRIVARAGTLTAPTVKVTGTARAKHTLSATYTASGTRGADVTASWTRDGVDVPGGSGSTLAVGTGDAGHAIAFRTTSTMDDVPTLVHSTAALRIPAYVDRVPTISGTARVGKTLTVVSKGRWYAYRYAFTYRWLRGGAAISGATKASYRLTSKDKGKAITLRVTAKKSAYATVTARSAAKRVR